MPSTFALHVVVTTYDRPQCLSRLLMQLKQQRGVRLDIHVYNDGPNPPPINSSEVTLHTTSDHLGKSGYWRLFNYAWSGAHRSKENGGVGGLYDYILFVQDDISIEDPHLLVEACEELEGIETEVFNVASFNLFGDGPEWESVARWTGRPAVQTIRGWVYAHWVDLQCVLFTPAACVAVPALYPPPQPYGTGAFSSGVGAQLSKRFDEQRMAQLMTPEPLVEHKDGGVSKMNSQRGSQPYKNDDRTRRRKDLSQ